MQKLTTFVLLLCSFPLLTFTQTTYSFEPSPEHPFGLPHPAAPAEVADWANLIGECNCQSVSRNPDGSWGDTIPMIWRFKYIMNGWAVQDETLKADGRHSGSIRQFIADSSRWFVHYYSSTGTAATLPAWEGTRQENGKIILYRNQQAPNGMEGKYKITFSNISPEGFDWLGEWVDKAETFSSPTWRISCTKVKGSTTADEREKLLQQIKQFSAQVVAGDAAAVAGMYTEDGKIFPSGMNILEGRDALEKYWKPGAKSKVSYHKVTPNEIKFIGDYAYDYGYYEGETTREDGSTLDWAGKYVIIWKKVDGEWKIYLDIWNRT
jgi:ketosteroid isomerase-like protein